MRFDLVDLQRKLRRLQKDGVRAADRGETVAALLAGVSMRELKRQAAARKAEAPEQAQEARRSPTSE